MKRLFDFLDQATERRVRAIASGTSRRSALLKVAKLMVGSAFTLPVLPFDRSSQAHAAGAKGAGKPAKAAPKDTDCDYWRYCAVDGFLCSCCGGSLTQCPPGTEASKASWVGTCLNPNDGKQYLVSYNDCCGKTACGQCLCNNNERERPGYRLGVHNDINWCMANTSTMFHCTTSILVGVA